MWVRSNVAVLLALAGGVSAAIPSVAPAQVSIQREAATRLTLDPTVAQRAAQLRPVSPNMIGGLSAPNLPAPAFRISWSPSGDTTSINEGAQNDRLGRTLMLADAVRSNPSQCPYRVVFHWDGIQPDVDAGPWYTDAAPTATTDQKYPIINSAVYFRAPVIGNANFKFVTPPDYNSYVYVRNCRDEYSNALKFRIWPTTFQVTSVNPRDGFIAGQVVWLLGTGLAGAYQTDQKVMFSFKLMRLNASGQREEFVREFEAAQWGQWDERAATVYAPSLAGAGYTQDNTAIVEASVYVVRGLVRTPPVPVRYCATTQLISSAGSCWPIRF
jgi:hypothetical protein